ncbi:hypothetical protein [Streptomyces sp. ISL-10]|uniref:hypothetical protein n=1 Tax=Streptomyces sp. ISL-10 TaxID=2819172 RepID=UPI002035260F|nr:hypothetical protein [Streptomyces sp. ISL-10]
MPEQSAVAIDPSQQAADLGAHRLHTQQHPRLLAPAQRGELRDAEPRIPALLVDVAARIVVPLELKEKLVSGEEPAELLRRVGNRKPEEQAAHLERLKAQKKPKANPARQPSLRRNELCDRVVRTRGGSAS